MTETEQYLLKKIVVVPGTEFELDLRPEKSIALKPEFLEIKVFDKNGYETWVEIGCITVLGDPQVVNFDGMNNPKNRGSSWIFRDSKTVNFLTIGSSPGQGLMIYGVNPNDKEVTVYVKLKGTSASVEKIGRR